MVDKDGESDGQSIARRESQRLETGAISIQFKVFSSNSTTVFSMRSLLGAAFCWTANLLFPEGNGIAVSSISLGKRHGAVSSNRGFPGCTGGRGQSVFVGIDRALTLGQQSRNLPSKERFREKTRRYLRYSESLA